MMCLCYLLNLEMLLISHVTAEIAVKLRQRHLGTRVNSDSDNK